jgi:hypothetical protein
MSLYDLPLYPWRCSASRRCARLTGGKKATTSLAVGSLSSASPTCRRCTAVSLPLLRVVRHGGFYHSPIATNHDRSPMHLRHGSLGSSSRELCVLFPSPIATQRPGVLPQLREEILCDCFGWRIALVEGYIWSGFREKGTRILDSIRQEIVFGMNCSCSSTGRREAICFLCIRRQIHPDGIRVSPDVYGPRRKERAHKKKPETSATTWRLQPDLF